MLGENVVELVVESASQSFIPSGLFSLGGETTEPPLASAIFTGHIRAAEVRTNEVTGAEYFWAFVSTLGGDFRCRDRSRAGFEPGSRGWRRASGRILALRTTRRPPTGATPPTLGFSSLPHLTRLGAAPISKHGAVTRISPSVRDRHIGARIRVVQSEGRAHVSAQYFRRESAFSGRGVPHRWQRRSRESNESLHQERAAPPSLRQHGLQQDRKGRWSNQRRQGLRHRRAPSSATDSCTAQPTARVGAHSSPLRTALGQEKPAGQVQEFGATSRISSISGLCPDWRFLV